MAQSHFIWRTGRSLTILAQARRVRANAAGGAREKSTAVPELEEARRRCPVAEEMKVRFLRMQTSTVALSRVATQKPLVDFQSAKEAGLAGKSDIEVLEIASSLQRVLATHEPQDDACAFAPSRRSAKVQGC